MAYDPTVKLFDFDTEGEAKDAVARMIRDGYHARLNGQSVTGRMFGGGGWSVSRFGNRKRKAVKQ